MPALRGCLDRYGNSIKPGDVFINNDPYEGGSHLPDIFLYKPLFVQDTLLGYACAMAHQTDIGGRVAGGNASDSTSIYQEGLRIPCLKLYEEGRPNEAIFRILEKAVRTPKLVLGDLAAQVAALSFAEREMPKLARRYGAGELLGLADDLLDYTETLTRQELRKLPNGSWTFTDYVDGIEGQTPEIPIVATIRKKDDEFIADFTGTGPQCEAAIQPVLASTISMVYSALRNILGIDADIPNTEGYFRPVTVIAPLGSFVNPVEPAPVAARAIGCVRVHQTLMGAFAKMLPEKVYACTGGCEYGASMSSYDKSEDHQRIRIHLEFLCQSCVGAFPFRDGQDAQMGGSSNDATIPAEIIELEHPFVVEEFGLLPDSEGAGKYRGGLGMVRQYRFLEDTQIQMRTDRTRHAPYGLSGGESSQTTKIFLTSKGETKCMPGQFIIQAGAGDVLRMEFPGAGGWGSPLERDPNMVLDDVVQGKMSRQRADEKYGVVLGEDTISIDLAATREKRTTIAG